MVRTPGPSKATLAGVASTRGPGECAVDACRPPTLLHSQKSWTQQPPLEQVRPQIQQQLERAKIQELQQKLRASAKVE